MEVEKEAAYMDELLQEMRENIQILMETAEVLENQIQRLQNLNPEEAREFISMYQAPLTERNISVDSKNVIEEPSVSESVPAHLAQKRKKSVMSKI